MRKYIGPKGYGANPETGGTAATGRYRMQSVEPLKERLTRAVKERIQKEFAPFNADIKKIDKTKGSVHIPSGYVRIWYNNDSMLYSSEDSK